MQTVHPRRSLPVQLPFLGPCFFSWAQLHSFRSGPTLKLRVQTIRDERLGTVSLGSFPRRFCVNWCNLTPCLYRLQADWHSQMVSRNLSSLYHWYLPEHQASVEAGQDSTFTPLLSWVHCDVIDLLPKRVSLDGPCFLQRHVCRGRCQMGLRRYLGNPKT